MSTTSRFDVIVLGAGGVGSAAAMHLAQRGLKVAAIDRHAPPHGQGSSHGQTRVIRQAYFEHPAYVPLLQRAYTLWDELEAESGRTLFRRVGLIEAGPPDGVVVPGVKASAAEHRLAVQPLTWDEARRRMPLLRLDPQMEIVFEENAGYLLVEDCVDAHWKLAAQHGAKLEVAEIIGWTESAAGVMVETTHGKLFGDSLVITAGAWFGTLLPQFANSIRVLRKHLHWHPSNAPSYAHPGTPVYFVEEFPDDAGQRRFFYGFPKLDERGVKVAEHSGGAESPDPTTDDRQVEADDVERVADFVSRRLTEVSPQASEHAVCFYTMTPDDHFIVDRASSRVVFAGGLSGHGFKFTTVLGELLAQMAVDEPLGLDLDFFSAKRFT